MLFKSDKWWVYKIAGGLLTLLVFTMDAGIEVSQSYFIHSAVLFCCFILLAVFGHVLNDLTDFEADRASGKSNIVVKTGTSKAFGLLFATLSLSIALSAVFLGAKLYALVLSQAILNFLYSVKPFRFKERGFLALLVTGFYERALPYLMIAVLLLDQFQAQFSWMIAVYLAWSYMWELRNFIAGQLNDAYADEVAKQQTLTVIWSSDTLRKIRNVLFGLEIPLFIAWIGQVLFGPILLLIAIVFCAYHAKREVQEGVYSKNPLFSFADNIYNLSLPVLIGAVAVHYDTGFWFIFLLHLFGFDNHVRMLFVILLKNIDWQKWWRWLTFPWRMTSLVFNWSLYYFRKWILGWSEEKNWGKHYPEYLERQRLKSEKHNSGE